jgi:hypothetical protein
MKSLILVKSFSFFTIFLMLGCTVSSTKNSEMAEQQVIQVMERFFEILDVDNYERNLLEEVVTEDFKIFEAGEVMDIERFHAFVTHVDPNVAPLSETSWTLSEFDISLDNNSAHVSYINRGIFKHGDEMTAKLHWMESAYLIKQADNYKIRFLNSNVVSRDFAYK